MQAMQYMRHLRWIPVLVVLLVAPHAAAAQQQPGYAGSASCADCHKKQVAQFNETSMGALMNHPRTEHEKLGCEACHGPSKEHAESGGEQLGTTISFSRKSKTAVAERNERCLSCHEKTSRTLWQGSTHESRNVACTDCHAVMH